MSNFQEYPQAIYPETGDVESQVGGSNLIVVGIQQQPVNPVQPNMYQSLVYENGEWTPDYSPFNRSIQCNGLGLSDDYDVFVNNTDVSTVQVNSSFPPNGEPIFVNGAAA